MIIEDILAHVLPAVFNRPHTNYWLRNASFEEIEAEREKLRKPAYFAGDRKARRLTDKMDDALLYRRNAQYKKEHPNEKATNHEHGWHLPGDY